MGARAGIHPPQAAERTAAAAGDTVHAVPRTVYLVRHGRSAWNGRHRVTGQCDPELSPEGRAQARCLASALEGRGISAIYTSTLGRTVETARPLAEALGLEINRREGLREQHMGVLQGRFRDERDPEAHRLWQDRKADILGYRPPGGESLSDVFDRVSACLEDIMRREAGREILIVGHRNANRTVLAALMGWPVATVQAAPLTDRFLYEIAPGTKPQIATISLRDMDFGKRWDGFKA